MMVDGGSPVRVSALSTPATTGAVRVQPFAATLGASSTNVPDA